MTNTMMLVGND